LEPVKWGYFSRDRAGYRQPGRCRRQSPFISKKRHFAPQFLAFRDPPFSLGGILLTVQLPLPGALGPGAVTRKAFHTSWSSWIGTVPSFYVRPVGRTRRLFPVACCELISISFRAWGAPRRR